MILGVSASSAPVFHRAEGGFQQALNSASQQAADSFPGDRRKFETYWNIGTFVLTAAAAVIPGGAVFLPYIVPASEVIK